MSKMNIYKVFILICLNVTGNLILEAKNDKHIKEGDKANSHTPQIFIVGLDDNVKSNYFYTGMIAEETGMEAESIDREYNRIIAENIVASSKTKECLFIPANQEDVQALLRRSIRLNGENEHCYSDLSSISPDEWKTTLDNIHADYVLVLNQHYLKWQETPLRTLFHIVSYTLFDKDKREIYRGNNYFACMHPEKPEELRKISKKSSSKIASNIIKSLNDRSY